MADVVGHGNLELVAEAGEVLAEGLAAGREGARGRRQRSRVAAGVRLRALLAQAVLLRADERHLIFVVNLEVGDGEVNHRDYERGYRDRHRVDEVHVHLVVGRSFNASESSTSAPRGHRKTRVSQRITVSSELSVSVCVNVRFFLSLCAVSDCVWLRFLSLFVGCVDDAEEV